VLIRVQGSLCTFFLTSRNGGEVSTRDLQKMVQALPQYSDQIDKLSLHVEVRFFIFGSYGHPF
jgi:hypothetical protein